MIFSESVGSGASLSAEPRDSSGQNPQDPCLADFFVSCAVVFFLFQERAGPHGGLPSIRRPRKAASAVRTNSERYDVAGGSPSRSGGRASGLRSSIDVVEGRRQFAAPRARTPHGPRAAGGTDNRKLRRMQARTLRGAQREAVASERNDFAPAGKGPAGAISCLRRMGSAHPAPELGADDARGHGHVERLGARAVGGERRDVEAPRNAGGGSGTHAAAFVAHDDNACGREVGAVEVLAVEKGAVDGDAGGGVRGQVMPEVGVVDPDAQYGAHGGLHDLRVEAVGRGFGAHDVADAEPVGEADDGAHVAGVLHVVERQHESARGVGAPQVAVRHAHQGQRAAGGLEVREAFHLLGAHGGDLGAREEAVERVDAFDAEVGGPQLADQLLAFGEEESRLGAGPLVGQRAHELYFGFRNHRFLTFIRGSMR